MRGVFDDTIAAVATAPGRGAVALLRLTGPDALRILGSVAPRLAAALPPARQQRLIAIEHPESGERLDRALVTIFPGPSSYTGEDLVEISTHGGTLTPQLVLGALYAAGARPAEPGEFTRRALFNGKIDLLQAEAIADLVDGRSPALHRAAVVQMERGLSLRIEELRRDVLRVEALIAYAIDFPEEDEPPVPPSRIAEAASSVIARIEGLLLTAPEGELLREGAMVVLAGRPNSGKSSLFNAMLGLERAIVTDVPGTTRDALESQVTIDGYPFRLVDTAGIHTTEDRVERMGIEVARRYLDAADLVLFCAEDGRSLDPEERAFIRIAGSKRIVVVRTKGDLRSSDDMPASRSAPLALEEGEPAASPPAEISTLTVSAHSGAGLSELRAALLSRAFGGLLEATVEAPIITRARHVRALRGASREVADFLAAMAGNVPMAFAATHLRAAAGMLEGMIGVVTPDDVLGEVFGSFCVGK